MFGGIGLAIFSFYKIFKLKAEGKWTGKDTHNLIKGSITYGIITIATIMVLVGFLIMFGYGYWLYFFFVRKVEKRPKTFTEEKPVTLDQLHDTSKRRNSFDLNKELQLGQTTSIPLEERSSHMYVVGKSGYGKSKALQFWLTQDIEQGRGAAVVDPHGDLIEDVFASLAARYYKKAVEKYGKEADQKEKVKDIIQAIDDAEGQDGLLKRIILIDPSNKKWAVGFNPIAKLEGLDAYKQALKLSDSVADVWGFDPTDAPVMTELLLNLSYLLAENNLTLAEALAVVNNPQFHHYLARNITNHTIKEFWTKRYAEWVRANPNRKESTANKLRWFTDPDIAAIVGQPKSKVDFREAMDEGKVILFNLAKGEVTEGMANVLGGLFLAYMHLAAMGRREVAKNERRPFYFYVDEFQSITSANFGGFLREDRKYGLHFILANQDLTPLTDDIKSAIFGNVNTILSFRVSPDDAVTIAKQLFRITGLLPHQIESHTGSIGAKGYVVQTLEDDVKYHTMDAELKIYAERLKSLDRRQFYFKYGEMRDPVGDITATIEDVSNENPVKYYREELKDVCMRRWASPKEQVVESLTKRLESLGKNEESSKQTH